MRDRSPPARAPPSSHAGRSVSPSPATSPPHTAQAPRRAGAMARAVVWRTLRCRGTGCGTVFSICGSCWRGQAYCGERCRATAQRRQRRRRKRAASAQPGRPARSPGPPTGLPRAVSPPARDGCTFPPPPSIHNHRTTRQARGHPARVPRVWARVGETSGLARATRAIGRGATTKGSRRWQFVTSRRPTGSRHVRWIPPRN